MPLAKFAVASLAITGLLSFAAAASAADAHPRVIGFERFHAEETRDLGAGGQLLLGELNCTSCHQADKSLDAYVQKKQAPVLDTVGSRVRPNYLFKFLADPQATKPGTTMPNILGGLPEAERKEKVEAIVHFLATTGSIGEAAALRQSVNQGDNLYHHIGCLACHDPRKDDSPKEGLPTSIPLGTPSRKYTVPGLTQFLSDPLAVRPGGRMPHLNLEPQDARNIASFLLKDLDISSGLQFALYEGSWDRLPDFSKLTPKEVGEAGGFDIGVTKKTESFALRFDGHINIPKAGNYLFLIGSDDGSRLFIDGKLVIDNDGIHPYQQKRKQLQITAGLHAVAVEYFEQGGQEVLKVEFQAEGQPQQLLDTLIAAPPAKKPEAQAAGKNTAPQDGAFVVNNELAAKGKEYFTTLGCASCHNLKKDGEQVVSKLAAPPLTRLKASGGCLAETPAKTPFYALNARQREAISLALAEVKKPAEPPPATEELIARDLVRFNCVACHTRGLLGGVEEARNPHFQSDMPEMGDEGRLPPPLAGVGAKLRPEWMRTVFNEGAKDRPYMFTRMPKFGMANVGALVTALEEAGKAGIKPAPKLDVEDSDKKFKAAGRRLVGGQAFGCIKCHTFADKKSTGIQALSLTTMTKRLRPEWFHHYMQNPQAFRPGTRMPNVFPDGQTTLPKVLDGSVDKQDRAMWAYLSDGDKAILPVGLVTGTIELVAYDEAIMYRNFIEGAGPRAIGVGFPEKLNLAFDANNLRLALIWQGAFMDAARHWEGRGVGFEPPLGDNVIKLTDGVPFAALENDKAPWPGAPGKEQGYRFGGYVLGPKRVPTFEYRFGEIRIADHTAPYGADDVFSLRRTLSLVAEKPIPNLYFRAAAAGKIEDAGGGSFKIDGQWTMKIGSPQKPLVRENSGKWELLVPVTFDGKAASITQEFEW